MRHLLLSPLTLALALAAGGLASTAHAAQRLAAPPEFLSASAGTRWQAVDDDVLAQQSGKGPGGTMVSGLVLELLSQWQMPNGASASAQGTLTVSTNPNNALSAQVTTSAQASDGIGRGNGNANGNANANGVGNGGVNGNSPQASVASTNVAGASNSTASPNASGGTTSTTAAAGSGANPHASAVGGQNVSVAGVSQITQVAGNGNVGANSTVIDFNGSGIGSGTTVTATSPTATATSASGNVKAGISFANGGVAVTVQTPAGVATQTIVPAGLQRGGSIAQLLQIAGNGQAVINQLKLSIQTQPMSAALLRQLGVQQALRNAAALRR
ncbi:peptidase C39 [Trinickia sp. Y13]|uniref:peptidase C39 n=1 Tax=Trinickia sp. Y13 TaxID=2917807 RepID=UPI0024052F93|nr:peptidase C39 [Trinickia sp. Y13]MDG0027147.1 peptidase C39 [Trinickia sp. Y13]